MKTNILQFTLWERNLVVFIFLFSLFLQVDAQKILIIGDSNAAIKANWVDNYLIETLPDATILNKSIPGNTIGFDNNNRTELNTLRNINKYLSETKKQLYNSNPTQIIISLGTNDCKKVFESQMDMVVANMDSLIRTVLNYYAGKEKIPGILIISPPPAGPDEMLAKKYLGQDKRVESLTEKFKKLALNKNVDFLDIYHPLKPVFSYITLDGIHLNREGQIILSRIVLEYLKSKSY